MPEKPSMPELIAEMKSYDKPPKEIFAVSLIVKTSKPEETAEHEAKGTNNAAKPESSQNIFNFVFPYRNLKIIYILLSSCGMPSLAYIHE